MYKIIFIMSFLSSLFGANAQKYDHISVLNPQEFKEAISEENVQLIDVRTAQESSEGAIKNSINIDFFQQETFENEFSKLDKEKPVYVYCRSGNRSHKAAVQLESMGFNKIYDLKGGYVKWPFKD